MHITSRNQGVISHEITALVNVSSAYIERRSTMARETAQASKPNTLECINVVTTVVDNVPRTQVTCTRTRWRTTRCRTAHQPRARLFSSLHEC